MKKIINETEINLNSCGYSFGVNLLSSSFNSIIDTLSFQVKKGYQIYLITKGSCNFSFFGKKTFCQQNDIIIQPNNCNLTFHTNENLEFYYITLSGVFVDEAIKKLNLSSNEIMIHGIIDSRIKNAFSSILSRHSFNLSIPDKVDILFSVIKILAILIENSRTQLWKKVPFSDPRILYTGNWVSWPTRDNNNSEEFYTSNESSYVEYNFYGTGIRWVGTINFDCGIADVIIDGNHITTIDTYNTTRITNQVLYINTALDKGHHIIKIFCTGKKNPLSTNTDITLESFHVYNEETNYYHLKNDNILKEIQHYISLNLESVTINLLSEKFNLNRSYLLLIFKSEFGVTISEYIKKLKIKRSKELLSDSNISIQDITKNLGYCDYSYFIKVFKNNTGISPSEFRKKNKKYR